LALNSVYKNSVTLDFSQLKGPVGQLELSQELAQFPYYSCRMAKNEHELEGNGEVWNYLETTQNHLETISLTQELLIPSKSSN